MSAPLFPWVGGANCVLSCVMARVKLNSSTDSLPFPQLSIFLRVRPSSPSHRFSGGQQRARKGPILSLLFFLLTLGSKELAGMLKGPIPPLPPPGTLPVQV